MSAFLRVLHFWCQLLAAAALLGAAVALESGSPDSRVALWLLVSIAASLMARTGVK